MALSQTERPAYYEAQYLDATDLTAAVDYARIQQARHALGGHTWGIAMGLDLRETPEAGGTVSVHVLPGYAWDGYGRPIVVLSPYRIPEEKFASFIFDPAIDSTGKGRLVPIWLAYYESAAALHSGFDRCANAASYARIQETFRIEVGETADLTSGINIAGRSLSDPKTALKEFNPDAPLIYDQSVPHQEYSTLSARRRWLIPIGFVRWQPVLNQPGHFVARDDSGPDKDSDKIRRVRRYVGLIAGEIGAADNVIRLRNRGRDPANSFTPLLRGGPDDVAVLVEGTVHQEGDTSYYGGGVDFRTHDGTDLNTPMSIRRNDAQPTARALQVVIGPSTQFTNKFAIGTLNGDNFEGKFVFLSGGNAGIGTATPTDKLHVAGDLRITGVSRKPGGGSWTSASDIRLKKEVAPLTDALEKVLQLHGFSFEWKEPEEMGDLKGPQIGLVAQDVEKVFPEWVTNDANGYRELTVRGFEALAIEAIRELKAEVDDLKAQIEQLTTPKSRQKKSKSKTPAAK